MREEGWWSHVEVERFKVVMEGGRDDGGISIHQVYIAEANLSGGVRLRRLVGRESMVTLSSGFVQLALKNGRIIAGFHTLKIFFIVRV